MDYGKPERRKTKKDLKRKRLAGRYKRGGKFRTQNVSALPSVPRKSGGKDEEVDKKKAEKLRRRKDRFK